jgi:hypothetical protein
LKCQFDCLIPIKSFPTRSYWRSPICTLLAVDSETTTIAQAQRMHDALAPTLGYLTRLQQRMDRVGFIPADPLYRDVRAAHDVMHALVSRLHYMTCESGVGQVNDRR